MSNKLMHRPKVREEQVAMFWELGLDTYEMAARMGAREWDVYRVLSKWREKQNDPYNASVSAKRK